MWDNPLAKNYQFWNVKLKLNVTGLVVTQVRSQLSGFKVGFSRAVLPPVENFSILQ